MKLRRLILFIAFISFLFSSVAIPCVSAEKKQEKQVIKVGFPIQGNLTNKDENGNYYGYTVDYLEEIKKYTGWDYEFVEAQGTTNEQLIKLLEMLQNGEIDLMGTMVYNDSTAEIYDFPGYYYGMRYTSLAVRSDDDRWIGEIPSWSGMTVGIFPGLAQREKQLRQFAELNGFSYELVEYETYDELLEALYDGSIDATLDLDITLAPGLKSIAKFTPLPFYFATTKGNTKVVSELNNALSSINSATPTLASDLHDKYFSTSDQFSISDKNKEYIKSLGIVNILMIDGNAPIQYKDGEAKGVSISYLEAIKKATGLQYNIIVAEDYDEFEKIMKEQHIDLVIGVPTASDLIDKFDLTLSLPYLDNPSIKVANTSHNNSEENQIPDHEIYNTLSVLKQINKDKNTVAYLDSYSVNFYIEQLRSFNHIKIETNNLNTIQYAFGLVDKDKSTLLSIINNYINSVSNDELQQMIYDNLVIQGNYSLQVFIKTYYLHMIVIILLLILLILLFYLKLKSNHHKALALQNRRFSELSNLTDECIFEYNYESDVMNIQNNKVMFERRNQIENFMKYKDYDFLKDMIEAKQDASHDFLIPVKNENRWYRVEFRVVRSQDDKVSYALGKIYDVHDDILKHHALLESSRRDTLTNLLNRKGAEEYINAMLEHDHMLGIMILIDVDNFKLINDNLGHLAGDQLLQEISHLIDSFFRQNDIKCRLGGDEFIVFMHANMDKASLSSKLEHFINKANKQIFSKYQQYKLSFSVGATQISKGTATYNDLYQRADAAMYKAKMQGKNSFYIDDSEEY